jgi:hypothetical protein
MLLKPGLEIDSLRQMMFRQGEASLHVLAEIGRITCPRGHRRSRIPRPAHRLKGKKGTSLSKTFLQPKVGRVWRATSPVVISKKSQDMGQLVSELKAVLRPIRIACRQTHSNTTIPGTFEVGLGVIASAIDFNAIQINIGALSQNLLCRRLKNQDNVSGGYASKFSGFHPNLEPMSARVVASAGS